MKKNKNDNNNSVLYMYIGGRPVDNIDGRVFGSQNSKSVMNWNRNNEEMHKYTMSFVCIK